MRPIKTDNIYAQTDAEFRELSRADYADFVASQTFPWKTWGDTPWEGVDTWTFLMMARAPGDPDRSTRDERRARGVGFSKHWEDARRVSVKDYERAICKATADGRPRSVQRLFVEAFDLEADMLPAVARLALFRLIYEEKLAFTIVPIAGYFVKDGAGRRRKQRYDVLLLWNDATWRRNHPEFLRTKRTAPMDLPESWAGQRPLRGTAGSGRRPTKAATPDAEGPTRQLEFQLPAP